MIEQEKTIKPESPKKSEKQPPENPYRKADYKIFVKFYALPYVVRTEEYKFKTEQDFAKHYNLSQDTLTDWKKRPEFQNDVDIQLAKWGADKTPNVLASLYNTILADGKASEVKLWYQIIKGWREGMIIEQPPTEQNNKLDKLLENADDKTKREFAGLLKRIFRSNENDKGA